MHPMLVTLRHIRHSFHERGCLPPHTLVLPPDEYAQLLAMVPPKVGPNAEWLWVMGFTIVCEGQIPLKACQCDGGEDGCTFPDALPVGARPHEVYD